MDQSQLPSSLWLLLFPITYLLHFAEEYWGGEGYPAYLKKLRGVDLPVRRFVKLETIGLLLIMAGCALAALFKFSSLMSVILGGVVLCNGITHTTTAIWFREYGPGLVVSALIWIPLGAASFWLMYARLGMAEFIFGVIFGLSINGGVALLTMRGGQFRQEKEVRSGEHTSDPQS